MSDSRVIVLLSGGVDSATLAASYAYAGTLAACVFVDYGQPATHHERAAAQTVAHRLETPLYVIQCPLRGLDAMRAGSPGDPCIVPVRNLTLCSIAINCAVTIGADTVALGATLDDHEDYIDCRRTYAEAINEIASLHGVRVVYPFAHMGRAAVVEVARRLGVDLDVAWSCYAPTPGGECGRCASCVAR
jgi:7-cyano-7-deazaguanine synthase